ncbi:hypothetical protein I7331_35100, partial [Frankia sp. AgB1.8]|nr:hypothetical protein [Frankia sp. AgB1.8]
MSEKDERPGRSGGLPTAAADSEAAGNPFFEKVGGTKKAAPAAGAAPRAARGGDAGRRPPRPRRPARRAR